MNLKRAVIMMLVKEFLAILVGVAIVLWFIMLVVSNHSLKQQLIESQEKNDVLTTQINEMNDQMEDLNKKIDELSDQIPK